MYRLRDRNRVADENEDISSDDGDFSSDDDDFVPSDDNGDDSSEMSVSETSDIIELDLQSREELIVHPQNALLSKDKSIQYSQEPFDVNRRFSYRRDERNILSGPKVNACVAVTDPLSSFLLFLKPIEHTVLRMTNLYGLRKHKEQWVNIDLDALRAYFGLLLLGGVYRSYDECITQLWDKEDGRFIFRKTMSLVKFKLIQSCIRFDDKNDRLERRERDKLAPIRNVYDKWNANLKSLYTLGKCITIDEQLVPYRGRCPFRQYIPSKPAKFGIKIWYVCDADTKYAFNSQVYVSQDRNTRPERNQGQRVVLELCHGIR